MPKSSVDRIREIDAAYSASVSLQASFASLDAFRRHMLGAAFDSEAGLQSEYPNAEAYVASAMRDGRVAGVVAL